MNMIEIVSPTIEEIVLISENLRPEDIAEISAASGLDPLTALMDSYDENTRMLFKNGEPVLVFGVSGNVLNKTEGAPWMVATPLLETMPVSFMKECKTWVDWMHDHYPILRNFCDARNEVHIKWLKRLGFEFVKLHDSFGVSSIPFWEFKKEKYT